MIKQLIQTKNLTLKNVSHILKPVENVGGNENGDSLTVRRRNRKNVINGTCGGVSCFGKYLAVGTTHGVCVWNMNSLSNDGQVKSKNDGKNMKLCAKDNNEEICSKLLLIFLVNT